MLAFWVGQRCDFLKLDGNEAKVMEPKNQRGIQPAHSKLCCFDVTFNKEDSYTAVLWCPQGTLSIPEEPNGPALPPSTDETNEEAPVTGLSPIYFSTCGSFLYSKTWGAFARALAVTDPSTPLAGRAVLDSFRLDALAASGGSWMLPKEHPQVMHEDMLYAVGRHRLKIFRICTYVVLGWVADADNLGWPVIPDEKEAPQPKDPTWYRCVLCAILKSMSTWHTALYWPKGGDECFILVLFPTPESRSCSRMPTVIYTMRSWLDVYCPEKGFEIEWLRGHASGCPY
ncbi:hypothetical protein MMYC01_207849 [Madurella mycetomatis]|uniref:Uncharacterized protein n=1 Tax=Madurella mycetomatis TaxID=100816 RepID=A0A175W038_9PEZI|nr:hypothetical protein MMYC01_207849 [Madurella mycetomatis]